MRSLAGRALSAGERTGGKTWRGLGCVAYAIRIRAQQYTEEMKRTEEEMKERLKKCLEPDCQVLTGWRRCAIHDHQWREQKRKERWAPRRREPADES
jgi:hypothetical protein